MNHKKGFTLIELVIVIVILGILALIAVPTYINLKSTAELNAMKASLGTIRSAVSLKHSQNILTGSDTYPSTLETTMFEDAAIPMDPINNVNTVATTNASPVKGTATGSGGWLYNATTGEVRCNDADYDDY